MTTQHHHGLQAFGASAVGSSHPRYHYMTKLDDRKTGFLESSKSTDLGTEGEVGRIYDINDGDSSRTFYLGEFGDVESDVK